MAGKWEQSRKNTFVRIAAGTFFLLIVAGVLIRNNTDLLSFSSPVRSPDTTDRSEAPAPPVQHQSAPESTSDRNSVDIPNVPPVDDNQSEDYFSVPLRDIRCTVLDRQDLTLVVSLNLQFHNSAQRDVILVRREDLKVAVQKVVAGKMLADMNVDSLKDELIAEMNRLLGSESVAGLEVLDFRPQS